MDRYLQYTESQLKVMAIVPKVTSFISLACMSYVGQLIIRFRRRRLYHNLFLGMAAHDIIKDLTFIVGTWAIPRGSPGYFMAWGDQTSCSVQAFLSQASFGVFTYVCAVCIFSCYAVRYDCKEESYRRRYEGIAHLVCTIIPIGFALALVISGFQGPDGMSRCMMPSFGMACENLAFAEDHCTDGDLHSGTAAGIFILHHAITSISFGIGVSSIFMMLHIEMEKRKRNKCLQGKRLYMETARRNKSKQSIILAGSHLFVTFGANCLHQISRNYSWDNSFGFELFAVIMTTMTGGLNASIYLSVKKLSQSDDAISELLSKHSIRKSIRSVENISVVSGGYQPKNKSRLAQSGTAVGTSTMDFGIYMGSENDGSENDGDDFKMPGGNLNHYANVSFGDPTFESKAENSNHA